MFEQKIVFMGSADISREYLRSLFENKYNIIEISRFGNFDCEGLEIKGYCESDDYAIYDIDSCNDSGGQWTSYVSEFNIEDFYMYNNGVCEFHLTEFCETLNFGSVYCNSLELNETCHQDAACFLNEHTLVYSENGEMSPYSFYQNHFDFYENNNPEYNYWTINPDNMISTDVIDGLVFSILNVENGSFKNSAWLQTDSYSGADDLIIVDVPSISARKIKLNIDEEMNLYFSKQDARIYST